MMESPPPDFLRSHPQTSPLHLCSPSFQLLFSNPISTPSQPQFSPIGLCFSPGLPPSPRETF